MRKFVGIIMMALAITSCGGSNETQITEPAKTPDAAPTAPAPEATPQSDQPGVIPVEVAACDLLTAEDVAAAAGLAVIEMRDEPPITCVFDFGDSTGVQLWVTIEDGQGRFAGPANLLSEYLLLEAKGDATVIADVGEQAVCCPFRTIAVDAGEGRFIALSVNGGYGELGEPRDVLVSLARLALERLG